jgi:hypothetical protein
MKTITITQEQWAKLKVGQLYEMAEYLLDYHSDNMTREENVGTRNDLNEALHEYEQINKAFKS